MSAYETFGQTVTQPALGRPQEIDMLGQQPYLLLQFTIHRLFRRFVGLDSTLRKLPGVLPYPAAPKQAVLVIAEDDPYVRPKAVGIYHI